MKSLFFILPLLIAFSCNSQTISNPEITSNSQSQQASKPNRPSAFKNGKFFTQKGKEMLYGGEKLGQHFDISNLELNKHQFHYGLGREAFPALIKPEFLTLKEADALWPDNARFLVAHNGGEAKAYAIKDLVRHEVVNDVLNGNPIMAAYCILADLGAIYERSYGDEVLTFALSGYTYYEPDIWNGLDAFVLWDRETESLWWPLIEKAVSGPLKGVKLMEMDKANWEDTTWGNIKAKYPQVQVLKSGQDFERPETWRKIDDVTKLVRNFSSGSAK